MNVPPIIKIPRRQPPTLLLAGMALLLLCGTAWAYGERPDGRQGGPPQEAIEACAGQGAGARVEFSGPRGGMVSGVCTERDGQLVAMPEGKSQGERGGRRPTN